MTFGIVFLVLRKFADRPLRLRLENPDINCRVRRNANRINSIWEGVGFPWAFKINGVDKHHQHAKILHSHVQPYLLMVVVFDFYVMRSNRSRDLDIDRNVTNKLGHVYHLLGAQTKTNF
ncbi:hypothetical protein TNCV_1823241 [Trichonephila clavipes]|nr:hypothetical protein TNCV_1823241 [Trichonephila clavipes]